MILLEILGALIICIVIGLGVNVAVEWFIEREKEHHELQRRGTEKPD
jgi:hypothetical protein